MTDKFEQLGAGSHNLKTYSTEVCEKFCTPIDYSRFCPDMAAAGLSSSHGPELFLWRKVEMEARSIVSSSFRYADPSPYKICAGITLAMLKDAPIPAIISEDFIASNNLDPVFHYRHALASLISATYCLRLLHTAEVGDSKLKLARPLKLSRHFVLDLVAALIAESRRIEELELKDKDLPASFSQIALIYEASSYISNPEAQNTDILEFAR